MHIEKSHNSKPRIHPIGNFEFSESSKIITMAFFELFQTFGIFKLAMKSNMTHFLISFGMTEKYDLFWTVFHLYWRKI